MYISNVRNNSYTTSHLGEVLPPICGVFIFFVHRCEKLILWYIYSRGKNLKDCSVKYSLHRGDAVRDV